MIIKIFFNLKSTIKLIKSRIFDAQTKRRVMQRSTENILTRITYFILPLLIITAIPSFISGGSIYKHYLVDYLIPKALGQDIITILCIPMLYWGHSLIGRGQQKGWVVFLSTFVYIFYAYSNYAFAGIFNALFPVYVALVGLSFYGAITGFLSLDITEFKTRVSKDYPGKSIAIFLFLSALVFCVIWLYNAYEAHITKTGSDDTIIYVLEMGMVLPAFWVASWWLWRGRNWGYAMGGILVLFSFLLGLSKVVAFGQQILKGFDVAMPMASFYLLFTLLAGALCLQFWGAVKEKRAWTIALDKNIDAPLEFVWKEINNFFQMDIPSVSIEKEKDGDLSNDNIGAVRIIKSGGITFREELIGYEPYFSYSYKMLSGLQARDYVGTVAVTEVDGERTMISWDVSYRYRFPFPGLSVKRRAKPVLQNYLDELKKNLERKYYQQQEAV